MSDRPKEVSDEELKKVIGDFLDQGHVDNIVAMFRRNPSYYAWTGDLLQDDRISVRLGLNVLFEELNILVPSQLRLAIPSLALLLDSPQPLWRGEAVSLLGIIGSEKALELVSRQAHDPDPQVREMVALVLDGTSWGTE